MNKPTPPAATGRSRPNTLFFICLALFIAGTAACLFVIKLDRHVEKTVGKVVETYSKRVFASRKKQYDEEYLVVRYSVGGKEYTGKTVRRKTGDFVTVYYYPAFPGMPWFYKKENPYMAYCCMFMAAALIGIIASRPRGRKTQPSLDAKMQRQKK
jgi:hypothetical protein